VPLWNKFTRSDTHSQTDAKADCSRGTFYGACSSHARKITLLVAFNYKFPFASVVSQNNVIVRDAKTRTEKAYYVCARVI